jgi:predicted ATPase
MAQMENLRVQSNLTEALKTYDHIELTEEEMNAAILWAKQKKDAAIQQELLEQRARENRRLFTGVQWSYEQTKSFMKYRADTMFKEKPFVVDGENSMVYELLLYYFSNDPKFLGLAQNLGIPNPSLDKGIMLAGNFGVGKTWFMKLFARNQRQCFTLKNAKDIADQFGNNGEDGLMEYVVKPKNPVNDQGVFYHTHLGLCIDDLGTEDLKNHFGNKRNVIGDLIEKRYSRGNTGVFLHTTTNLDAMELESFYGGRVTSRMREVFNIIEMNGKDRRK